MIFENSLNFGWMYFERIFKYRNECKSLIAHALIWLLIYYMTEKIANVLALICTAVQIKNLQ